MAFAPIALFVYNRLWHAEQTVNSLRNNTLAQDSELIVFSDGPKNEESRPQVQEVREYLKGISGFKAVKIVERQENWGLAKSIITGVSEATDKHGKIIVVEDDLVTSPYFLQFMNEGLDYYQDDERVISIHGYTVPVEGTLPETFFLRGADCWGWATWKRGWDLFEADGKKLLDELQKKGLTRKFDINNSYCFTQMLKDQIAGRNNSWAIRWHASAFLEGKFTLYPGISLVHNIGNDQSGTHCGNTNFWDCKLAMEPIPVISTEVAEDIRVLEQLEKFYAPSQSLVQPLKEKVKPLLPPVVLRILRKLKAKIHSGADSDRQSPPVRYGFFGNYGSWQEAESDAMGYDADLILEKVKKALLAVKNGEAVYERDSVLFEKIEYAWPLLAGLLWISAQNDNRLKLIDVGGSLGSSYFQNRLFLQHLKDFNWNVVEQHRFVDCGRLNFEDEYLKFFYSLQECLDNCRDINLLLFSSVLQYLEDPYAFLQDAMNYSIEYIIIDRTVFLTDGNDRITVQKVPPHIYDASYPAWFFNYDKLLGFMAPKYELVAEFDTLGGVVQLDDQEARHRGFIFRLKSDNSRRS